ncbi:MAG TPA: hypothetical protein GXZ20_08750 [Halanaerobiaceae bacterium]|jgi:hypothetical protein|nr:YlzJ-like family protein [Bacillota bacterium]HHU93202.1 hypothetical protein [Halanaerobiaceae bacterium]HOA41285.1 YlzJ-like family protein [Halanaerobiales bacterium]HPZ62523.1 YlzJ-like family protein [Halanaerobiales bacterium]HQD03742.1 YlzJ-like family protein [Halanaerobiales bacterium]
MLNYSIYPLEMVLEDYDNFEVKYDELILPDGLKILAERIDQEDVKVVKIISTDPQDYLRPELQPGTIIKAKIY